MQDHIIKKIETWQVRRNIPLFDNARTGRSPMPWDIMVVRITTDTGLVSAVPVVAPRSGMVTQSYLHDNISSVSPSARMRRSTRTPIWHFMAPSAA